MDVLAIIKRTHSSRLTPHMQHISRHGKLSGVSALLTIAAAILSGCAAQDTVQQKTASWSPNKIYAEARDESNSGGYDKAIPLYDVLEGRAAGTPLAQQAQLDKAYAQYRNGDTAEANATLNRFIQLNPSSPALDYAMYLKGIVNFNGDVGWLASLANQDITDRDQHAARESFDAFRALVSRFPNSRYTPDAKKRMTYIINSLAKSEVSVALYYYRHGAYVAAINRAQAAINNYQGAPAQQEALAIIAQSYDALGLAQPRDDTRRVLAQNYPDSPYLKTPYTGSTHSWWRLW